MALFRLQLCSYRVLSAQVKGQSVNVNICCSDLPLRILALRALTMKSVLPTFHPPCYKCFVRPWLDSRPLTKCGMDDVTDSIQISATRLPRIEEQICGAAFERWAKVAPPWKPSKNLLKLLTKYIAESVITMVNKKCIVVLWGIYS